MLNKIVIGSITSVILFIIVFFLSNYVFLEPAIYVPVELMYLCLVYGFVGCLVFVFVLPVILIINEKKDSSKSKI